MKAAMTVVWEKSDVNNKFWCNEANDENFREVANDINLHACDNEVILLKGSHSMQLEKLVPLLCGNSGEAC